MQATGIILAGGKSSRMGTNKALLEVRGSKVIERIVAETSKATDHLLLVTNTFEDYEFLELPMAEDEWKGLGPLTGIHTGLKNSTTDRNLVVACDMPFVSADLGRFLLTQLTDYEAVVPEIGGQLHPLFAAYSKNVVGKVLQALQHKQLRIRYLLDSLHVKIIREKDLQQNGIQWNDTYFYNMNHPEEYQQALRMQD
ncbi:molybdenum cofactor guanylyltransferase [Cytobacillus spongiae]|uniref:molybdenum cofactor guanylyltransferase n=1 Tax=Cytobacillus spongiae TaxID=2901381 RepID=UPI001F344FDD|nr:molybdenum cofactor guanylyltransferase [Cytobacillus spongiae]UII55809.1 molybdenum cofactor guanylyltransferase [Cytobacillus spongiae]